MKVGTKSAVFSPLVSASVAPAYVSYPQRAPEHVLWLRRPPTRRETDRERSRPMRQPAKSAGRL